MTFRFVVFSTFLIQNSQPFDFPKKFFVCCFVVFVELCARAHDCGNHRFTIHIPPRCLLHTHTRTHNNSLFTSFPWPKQKLYTPTIYYVEKCKETFHLVNANQQKVYHNIVLYSFVGRLCGIRHIPNDIRLSQRPIVATRQTTKDL